MGKLLWQTETLRQIDRQTKQAAIGTEVSRCNMFIVSWISVITDPWDMQYHFAPKNSFT